MSISYLKVLDLAISLVWAAMLNDPRLATPGVLKRGDAKNAEKKLVSFNSELLETSKKHVFKKCDFLWNYEKKFKSGVPKIGVGVEKKVILRPISFDSQ